jgi:hypothetical protein
MGREDLKEAEMAGIKRARKLAKEGKDKGRCIATGYTFEGAKYIIIDPNDAGWFIALDYDSDIHIDPNIAPGDYVKLEIYDGYTAEWVLEKRGGWAKSHKENVHKKKVVLKNLIGVWRKEAEEFVVANNNVRAAALLYCASKLENSLTSEYL